MNGQLDLVKTSSVVYLLPYTLRRYARIPSQWRKRRPRRHPFRSRRAGRAFLEWRGMKTMARLLPILLTLLSLPLAGHKSQAVSPTAGRWLSRRQHGRRAKRPVAASPLAFNNTAVGFFSLKSDTTGQLQYRDWMPARCLRTVADAEIPPPAALRFVKQHQWLAEYGRWSARPLQQHHWRSSTQPSVYNALFSNTVGLPNTAVGDSRRSLTTPLATPT